MADICTDLGLTTADIKNRGRGPATPVQCGVHELQRDEGLEHPPRLSQSRLWASEKLLQIGSDGGDMPAEEPHRRHHLGIVRRTPTQTSSGRSVGTARITPGRRGRGEGSQSLGDAVTNLGDRLQSSLFASASLHSTLMPQTTIVSARRVACGQHSKSHVMFAARAVVALYNVDPRLFLVSERRRH